MGVDQVRGWRDVDEVMDVYVYAVVDLDANADVTWTNREQRKDGTVGTGTRNGGAAQSGNKMGCRRVSAPGSNGSGWR